jgi:serine/threonine protein kinase
VGPYRIEGVIGFTRESRVYLARDLRSGRKVALKMAKAELFPERFSHALQHQAQVMVGVEHPNVMPIDVGEVDDQLYMAMPYVPAGDLGGLLAREGPLSVSRTVRIVGQVADALESLHARGICHGDVSPSNVLIGDDDTAYLVDVHGTPSDEPSQDASDLGWLLYACLSGFGSAGRPIRRRDRKYYMGRVQQLLHRVPYELSEGQRRVIAKALAAEPDDGYTTCTSLMNAVQDEFV